MLNNLIGLCIISFVCALSVTELSAQIKNQEKTKSQVVIVEKTIEDDGTVTTTKKILEGKEAEDYIKSQLEVEPMEIEMDVDVDQEVKGIQSLKTETKKYKVISINKDGQKEEIEWDGTGEMPERLKEIIEGEALPTKTNTKKITIIKKDGDSTTQTQEVEWDENDIPEDVKTLLEKEGIDLNSLIEKDGPQQAQIIRKGKESFKPKEKGALGVAIGDDKLGVMVSMVQPDSAAEIAGIAVYDVITKVNDVKITTPQSLIEAIANYSSGDEVSVTYLRNKEKKTSKVILKAPYDPFPFKTWEQVMSLKKD